MENVCKKISSKIDKILAGARNDVRGKKPYPTLQLRVEQAKCGNTLKVN